MWEPGIVQQSWCLDSVRIGASSLGPGRKFLLEQEQASTSMEMMTDPWTFFP
jgi:hypothetical protein